VRTSFELKFTVLNYQSAIEATAAHIGRFLDIDPEEVSERVDTELKVELNEICNISILANKSSNFF
jgi:hypothetical protein